MSIRGLSGKSLILVVGMAVGIMLGIGVSGVSAQCRYEATIFTGSDCSPGDPASFSATDIDEQGNVAGRITCFSFQGASLWTGGAQSSLLSLPAGSGNSGAFGMFDPDHVVGSFVPPGGQLGIAIHWESGTPINLGTLPGDTTSAAGGINSLGQFVGFSLNNSTGPDRAVIWDQGKLSVLNLPAGHSHRANAINEKGQITGSIRAFGSFIDFPFLCQGDDCVILPPLVEGFSSTGRAINNHGLITGLGVLDVPGIGVTRHAFLWNGREMIDLGTLPGHERSFGTAINDLSLIVGMSSEPFSHAFLWQHGTMYNLDDLTVTDLGGRVITSASGINNQGLIIADAFEYTVLLTPIDSPIGDIDKNCLVNVSDLILLLHEWGKEGSFADIDSDGDVDAFDLIEMFMHWGESNVD